MKIFSFYLPAFHEMPENNKFWGKGFTEWDNVRGARPLFKGHKQPRVPSFLGYYDLTDSKTVRKQIALAKSFGIDGFGVYIYWFNGKPVLHKPLKILFAIAEELGFKLFLIWANENWSRRWDGLENDILIKQKHKLEKDLDLVEFYWEYFSSEAYFKLNDKLFFSIYRPSLIKNINEFNQKLRATFALHQKSVHLSMVQSFNSFDPRPFSMDSAIQFPPQGMDTRGGTTFKNVNKLRTFSYKNALSNSNFQLSRTFLNFPGVLAGWDNTPRKGINGDIALEDSAIHFFHWLKLAAVYSEDSLPVDSRLIFINAWNEWGEGAYLEPDIETGLSKLYAVKLVKDLLERQGLESSVNDKFKSRNFLKSFNHGPHE